MGFCFVPSAVMLSSWCSMVLLFRTSDSVAEQLSWLRLANPRLVLLCVMGILALAMMHQGRFLLGYLCFTLCALQFCHDLPIQRQIHAFKKNKGTFSSYGSCYSGPCSWHLGFPAIQASWLYGQFFLCGRLRQAACSSSNHIELWLVRQDMPQILFELRSGLDLCILKKNCRWLILAEAAHET